MKNNRLLRWIIILLMILPGLFPTVLSARAQNTGVEWKEPVLLSSASKSAWFADVAADPYGTIHVAWSQANGDYDTVMYTSSTDGLTWAKPNDIVAVLADRGSEATRPVLEVMDAGSRLHLIYRYNLLYAAEAFIGDASKASAWTTYATLSDINQVAYYSSSGTDSSGTQHILLSWNVPSENCEICYHVFYRNRTTDAIRWTDFKDISINDFGAAKPELLVDSKDRLHAIWEVNESGGGAYGAVVRPSYLMYTRSTDDGQTWSKPIKLSAFTDESRNPAISEDRNGRIMAVWLGLPDDRIYYQTSSDGGANWTAPAQVPGIVGGFSVYASLLDDISMARDSDGNVHMIAIGRLSSAETSLSVLHLTWDGSAWTGPEIVASYRGEAPEWPKVTVSNGNLLNVVWHLRDKDHVWDTVNGKYTIWYARGVTTARHIDSQVLLTPTPSPVIIPTSPPTQQSTPELSITATAQVPENYTPNTQMVYKETQYLKYILLALLPVLLFIVVVVAVVLIRRNR